MRVNDEGITHLHPDSPVRRAALEVEQHVGEGGWDQAPRLFALVSTAGLVAREPQLAETLGDGADGSFTPVEQDGVPPAESFEADLAAIEWPEAVDGCAAVVERVMLPPEAEADLPDDPAELAAVLAAHPGRQEVRLVAAVLRDGSVHSAVRRRAVQGSGPDEDSELLEGPDLVPGLVAILATTLDSHV